jgi:hypothetical protein
MTAPRCILCVIVLAGLAAPGRADTGTYEIPEYRVTLELGTDGLADVTYYQKWRVTGGNIPWITVGMPHRAFAVDTSTAGGAVRSIREANKGSWSGVRIDLDRKYLAGDTFEVRFTVRDVALLYEDPAGYKLDFVPGWYDRAKIGALSVELTGVELSQVAAVFPPPTEQEAERLLWQQASLPPGARYRVQATLPQAAFEGEVITAPATDAKQDRGVIAGVVSVCVIAVVIVIGIAFRRRGGGGYGGGGHVALGGAHYVATTHAATSCACACVACACACACAGGGAAGCDRKLQRTCPLCDDCEHEACPLRRPVPAAD